MTFCRRCRLLLAVLLTMGAAAPAIALEPFLATYQAYNAGKLAGDASLRVAPETSGRFWRIDLDIHATRGLGRLIGLDIDQSTLFEVNDEDLRPLRQTTSKRALLAGRKSTGTYDWAQRMARWEGDVSKSRRAPVPLLEEDLSSLLVNLAVMRDAEPGRALAYRVVDNGRARDHRYQVRHEAETIAVGELSYEALRVERSNGGNDETIFWIASGVPTPVRILQRENGADTIDLRLVEYQGATTR